MHTEVVFRSHQSLRSREMLLLRKMGCFWCELSISEAGCANGPAGINVWLLGLVGMANNPGFYSRRKGPFPFAIQPPCTIAQESVLLSSNFAGIGRLCWAEFFNKRLSRPRAERGQSTSRSWQPLRQIRWAEKRDGGREGLQWSRGDKRVRW